MSYPARAEGLVNTTLAISLRGLLPRVPEGGVFAPASIYYLDKIRIIEQWNKKSEIEILPWKSRILLVANVQLLGISKRHYSPFFFFFFFFLIKSQWSQTSLRFASCFKTKGQHFDTLKNFIIRISLCKLAFLFQLFTIWTKQKENWIFLFETVTVSTRIGEVS